MSKIPMEVVWIRKWTQTWSGRNSNRRAARAACDTNEAGGFEVFVETHRRSNFTYWFASPCWLSDQIRSGIVDPE